MVSLVIFDMDGLMFDTEEVTFRAFMEKVAAWGYEPAREQYVQFLGLNAQSIYQKYREFFSEDLDAEELYRQVGLRKADIIREEGLPVKRGLFPLLDFLEENKIKKAVASGSDVASIRDNLRDAGLTGRFDMVLSTEQVPRGKPFPDAFLAICKELGTDPGEALVLEDAANGVQAALLAGIPVINVPDMIPLPEDLKRQCLKVVPSLYDVISFLLQTSGPASRATQDRRHKSDDTSQMTQAR